MNSLNNDSIDISWIINNFSCDDNWYVKFSLVAHELLWQQTQYASRYADDIDEDYPNFWTWLRFIKDCTEYHDMMIHKDDILIFAIKVLEYRKVNGMWLWEKSLKILEECNNALNNIIDNIKNNQDISIEKIEAVWLKWYKQLDVTIKTAIEDNLSVEQIEAIWGKYLVKEWMTDEKITVIGYMLWAEDIIKIWLEELVNMNIDKLNELINN